MKFDRIFVFGDSYVDNYRINKKSGIVPEIDKPKLWIERLVEFYAPNSYFNYGHAGSDSKSIIIEIKKHNFLKHDLIVAVLSNNPPSGVENNLEYQKYIMNLPCAKIIFHNDYLKEYKSPCTYPLSLEDISTNEILSNINEIKKRRYDRRIGHMSWINHDILFDSCIKMINGDNNFYYEQFEFKFLTLDEAFHPDTESISSGLFIYD
tara:strand:- start:680 stop:1300 length:621 start_codon:yes stop_codon:yes gene_type:complete